MQLARHGGLDGLRDKSAVESALERAQQLAATCAYGLARNHGFSGGNRRTARVITRVFLLDNVETLGLTDIDAIHVMQDVAAGTISEQELAQWFRQRLTFIFS